MMSVPAGVHGTLEERESHVCERSRGRLPGGSQGACAPARHGPSAARAARPGTGSVAGCRAASIPRKEVIQPHLPVRLPCYDFTPVTRLTLDSVLRSPGWTTGFRPPALPWCDGRCVQGPGTYSPPCADRRLLATPPSGGRVAAPHLNLDRVCRDWLQ